MEIIIITNNFICYHEETYENYTNEIAVSIILNDLSIEFDFINDEDIFRNYNYRLPSHLQISDFIYY